MTGKTPGVSGVNLLPGKTQEKQQAGINPTKVARVGCIIAMAFLLITGAYYFWQKGGIDATKRQLTQRLETVNPKLQQIQQSESQRSISQQRAGLLKRIDTHTDWTEVLRSISFVVPPTALFENIHIDGSEPAKLMIRGYVTSASAAEGNADFNRFFTQLGALPFFRRVSLPHPTSVSSIDSPAVSNVNNAGAPRSKVSFDIECELQ